MTTTNNYYTWDDVLMFTELTNAQAYAWCCDWISEPEYQPEGGLYTQAAIDLLIAQRDAPTDQSVDDAMSVARREAISTGVPVSVRYYDNRSDRAHPGWVMRTYDGAGDYVDTIL